MADTTPSYIRGFMVPHPLGDENTWDAQSSFTQQGNVAGDPVPQQDSDLVVQARGTQLAGSDLQIVTRVGGYPSRGAKFTWRDNVDSTSIEYGRDAALAVSGVDIVAFTSLTSVGYLYPRAVALDTGRLVVVYTDIQPLVQNIKVKYREENTDTYSSAYTVSAAFTVSSAHPPKADICKLADGSLLIAIYVLAAEAGSSAAPYQAQVKTYRSVDDGETWSLLARAALDESITIDTTGATYQVEKIRVRALGGQILLLLETKYNSTGALIKQNRLHQYGSIDGGSSFVRVTGDADINTNFFSIDLDVLNGEFVLAYIASTTSAHYITMPHAFFSAHKLQAASAYSTITTDTIATVSTGLLSDGELAMWVDNQTIQVAVYANLASNLISMLQSTDGKTFYYMGGGTAARAKIFEITDTSADPLPAYFSGCSVSGRNVLLTNWESTSSTTDNSLFLLYLGGYSNVTLPFRNRDFYSYQKATWSQIYVPIVLPSTISSITVAGSGTEALSAGGLSLSSSGAAPTGHIFYTISDGSLTHYLHGTLCRVRVDPTALGSISGTLQGRRSIILKTGDNTDQYAVRIQISTTQLAAYDMNGAQIGTNITHGFTGGVEILACIFENKFHAWYRENDTHSKRKYIALADSSSLSTGGGGFNDTQVSWGHEDKPSSGTMTSTFMETCIAFGSNVGFNLTGGFINPTDLDMIPYPTAGQLQYVAQGASISTADGTARYGDEYQIKTRFLHGWANAWYQNKPTPRLTWRSASVASGAIAQQTIAISLDGSTAPATEALGNSSIAVHLNNINFQTFEIEIYTGSSWSTFGTYDTGISFPYDAIGRSIKVRSTAGTTGKYIKYDECSNWTVKLVADATTKYASILQNSEGSLVDFANSKSPEFLLSTAAPAGTTRTATLIPNKATVIMNLGSANIKAIRLKIPSQETADLYFKIGLIQIGALVIPGQQYSRGRTINITANTTLDSTVDGIYYSTNNAPSRRRIRVAWTDAVDIRSLQGDATAPDYWKIRAADRPIAVQGDVPDLMLGLVNRLQGSIHPLLYLPSIEPTSSANILYTRDDEHALCILDGDVTIDNLIGDELIDEAFRVATISLEEIV
jgi:hypothetical protein